MVFRKSSRLFLSLFLPLLLLANGEMDEPKDDLTKEPTDFSECQKRVAGSMLELAKGEYAVLIGENRALYYSKKAPSGASVLKHDPYLGLYLLFVKSDAKPLEISVNYKDKDLASISKTDYQKGEIKRLGRAIGRFASFSAKTPSNSVIASICYQMHGLGIGGNEFIEARYLNRFLERAQISYADMGIEAKDVDGGVGVTLVDIFFDGNPFLEGDKIIEVNGQKITDLREFFDAYIYEPIGKDINVTILRNGSKIVRTVTLGAYSGGEGGFLERLGVMTDNRLRVVSNKESNEKLKWLKPGDKIVEVERTPIGSLSELRHIMSGLKKESISLLIEREGFQFFINLPNGRKP